MCLPTDAPRTPSRQPTPEQGVSRSGRRRKERSYRDLVDGKVGHLGIHPLRNVVSVAAGGLDLMRALRQPVGYARLVRTEAVAGELTGGMSRD